MKVELCSALRVQDSQPESLWILLEPLKVHVHEGQVTHDFAVPAGFVTDFASVPRLPVAFMFFGDRAHAAATVHDYLYSIRMDTRAWCDEVFYQAMLYTGVSVWRARLMWAAVRAAGWAYWNEKAPNAP